VVRKMVRSLGRLLGIVSRENYLEEKEKDVREKKKKQKEKLIEAR